MAIKKFESEIIEIRKMTPSVKVYKLSVPENFEFKAGQHINLDLIINGERIKRPYSIASNPEKAKEENFIELCIKRVENGPVSEFMHNLKENKKLDVIGPFGRFVVDESSKDKDIIFIAAGTGISPFTSMIPHLLKNGFRKNIILIHGVRTEKDVLFKEELDSFEKEHENFKFHGILSRPENQGFENKGHVQDFLEKHIPKEFNGHFYICGLFEMIKGASEKLREMGFSDEQIFFEKYD